MAQSVSVIGLGYVGLTMAACVAVRGIATTGVDVDKEKMALLRKGMIPFYEPGLQEILAKVSGNRLSLTDKYEEAIGTSGIIFITVGTPTNVDGSINLGQVKAACASIASVLKQDPDYHLIVVGSTVTPGTTEQIVKPLLESGSGKSCARDFGLCVNPEFVSEGRAVYGMLNPDRIVIGECNKRSGDSLENFYTGLYGDRTPPLLRTTPANAELIKYANNGFLATKVSFINSFANLCEHIPSSDIEVIAKGIGLDPRIGPLFLKAGLGWGGSCWPKDLRALLGYARSLGIDLPIIQAATDVNEAQPNRAVDLAKELIGTLKGARIAILGLSFKADTDDTRAATALRVIERLLGEGAEISVYDPKAMQKARMILTDKVRYAENASQCIEGADCCIIATEWNEFRGLTANDFLEHMRQPAVVDGRRIYDPDVLKSVRYAGIGLG